VIDFAFPISISDVTGAREPAPYQRVVVARLRRRHSSFWCHDQLPATPL
jgi:hypothetical protein